MLIQVPETIDHFLYQGPLQYNMKELQETVPSRGQQKIKAPEIGIGQPQWWNLAALAKEQGKPLPPEMALLAKNADFFLVHLACSFRPTRSSRVESASFVTYLRSKNSKDDVIAYDMFPKDIKDEKKSDVKIAISPNLKFTSGAEVGLGSFEIAFEYKKLEPVITAFGLLEKRVGWDFARSSHQDIRGTKSLFLIIKRPAGVDAVRATFELNAEVRIRQWLLGASVDDIKPDNRSAIICT